MTVKRKYKGRGKGANFERKFCRELSLWWSGGKSEDVFWRSQQSGGRATTRIKKGRKLKGQYGDVAAIHSKGEALLKFVTIELKCGYQKDTIIDLLDAPNLNVQQTWEKWIQQAKQSSESSKSDYWMIVHQRTRRAPLVAFPNSLLKSGEGLHTNGKMRYHSYMLIQLSRGEVICVLKLSDLFEWLDPVKIWKHYK